MAIKTPDILPGEKGYVSKKEKTAKRKSTEKKSRATQRKKDTTIGKIKTGKKGYRIGKLIITPRKERKYPIWRYSRKIGEILVKHKDTPQEEVTLKFNRLGGIGNHKHLIQDADFQLQWAIREQELLMTQDNCYNCIDKLIRLSGNGRKRRCIMPCCTAGWILCLAGGYTSGQKPILGVLPISRCKPTAPRCCGWPVAWQRNGKSKSAAQSMTPC